MTSAVEGTSSVGAGVGGTVDEGDGGRVGLGDGDEQATSASSNPARTIHWTKGHTTLLFPLPPMLFTR
jgi:hypothetical protein